MRVWPISSNAPALMSDSTVRLLQTTASTLSRKSGGKVLYFPPFALRHRMIESTTFWPTLRTAVSPKRITSSPWAAKLDSDSLTFGGSTLMPMRRHSFR